MLVAALALAACAANPTPKPAGGPRWRVPHPGSQQDFVVNVGTACFFERLDRAHTAGHAAPLDSRRSGCSSIIATLLHRGHADERGTREYNIALGARPRPDRARIPERAGIDRIECAPSPTARSARSRCATTFVLVAEPARRDGPQRQLLSAASPVGCIRRRLAPVALRGKATDDTLWSNLARYGKVTSGVWPFADDGLDFSARSERWFWRWRGLQRQLLAGAQAVCAQASLGNSSSGSNAREPAASTHRHGGAAPVRNPATGRADAANAAGPGAAAGVTPAPLRCLRPQPESGRARRPARARLATDRSRRICPRCGDVRRAGREPPYAGALGGRTAERRSIFDHGGPAGAESGTMPQPATSGAASGLLPPPRNPSATGAPQQMVMGAERDATDEYDSPTATCCAASGRLRPPARARRERRRISKLSRSHRASRERGPTPTAVQ